MVDTAQNMNGARDSSQISRWTRPILTIFCYALPRKGPYIFGICLHIRTGSLFLLSVVLLSRSELKGPECYTYGELKSRSDQATSELLP